jgi:hypothetical protein
MELLQWTIQNNSLNLIFNKEFNNISIIKIENQSTFDKYEFYFSSYKKDITLNSDCEDILILVDKLNKESVNYIFKIEQTLQTPLISTINIFSGQGNLLEKTKGFMNIETRQNIYAIIQKKQS